MKKNNLEVTCKLGRFGYWNSCKSLPKSVNVQPKISHLVITQIWIQHHHVVAPILFYLGFYKGIIGK